MRLNAKDIVMLVQLLVVLPHAEHLPYWLLLIAIFSILIQLSFVHQRLFTLSLRMQKILQGVVFLSGLFGIFQTFHTILGLEAGTAFLIICLLGKLFEVNTRRDAYVVLTLGLFVTAGLFLFDQGLMTTVLVVLATCSIFYAMMMQNIVVNESQSIQVIRTDVSGVSHYHALKTIFFIVSIAVPLMVILFIFFPRISPIWSIHLNQDQAKTGMSDSMSPGDIANLSQSTELAFRAVFQGPIPANAELYWRGLVLGTFDGRTWSPTKDARLKATQWGTQSIPPWLAHGVTLKTREPTKYSITVEPTQQPWLFALNFPVGEDSDVGLTREYTVQASDDIRQRTTYKLLRFNTQTIDADLPAWLAQDTLQLPENGNPQSRTFAHNLFKQANGNPELYASYVTNWIRHENFVYTLQPPPLSGDRIDEFLFKTRRGFCEHYSSAFTFLMRAAGIPARVVVGYQGGQLGRDGHSLEIRQMDAHAWSEIWLTGRGWVRYDPTAAIAPDRIERGMGALTSQNPTMFGDGLAGTLRYNQFKFFGQARQWVDYAKYLWQRDVVGFDQTRQNDFLFKFLGLRSQVMQIFVMFMIFALVLAIVVFVQLRRKRPKWHPLDIPLINLSRRLNKQGLARNDHEGMLQWLKRVELAGYEHQAKKIASIYRTARYSPDLFSEKESIKEMMMIVRRWRKE
ncbi:DUF3488 domain-containing protein [Aquirhabdus parva]|uniref:DUF3488 domain-containing protein n=1 Tax=Aquirhabdus parva TaxID=2283318 RepID=A0A345P6A7_9GAMM|nr:DUF3488 domain-containing protein [Aquirhabdus parva]